MSKAPSSERSTPLSVRFTDTEKARLESLAGGTPLSQFIRERALGDATEARARVRQPLKDAEPLGRLLGLLGQSRLANNLNQLAKAANQGSLPVTKEVEDDLRSACAQVFEMRLLLLKALGLKILDEATARTPLPEIFFEAAGGE
ncbi:MAG: plasmid mobilization protein [Pseudomonadota bacterium]